MFKKSIALVVSTAFLVAGPGHLTLEAAAQVVGRAPVAGVSGIPAVGAGLNGSAAASFSAPLLSPGALLAPGLQAAPSIAPSPAASLAPVAAFTPVSPAAAVDATKPVMALAATPVLPAAAKTLPANMHGAPLSVISAKSPAVGVSEKGEALNALYDNSSAAAPEALSVLGSAASVDSGLGRSEATSAKSPAAIERAALEKGRAAGAIPGRAWLGVVAGLAVEVGAVMLLGWPVAFPMVAAMTRAGMAAGFIGQISPDAKIAQVLGTIIGGLIGASVAPGALPILFGLVSGLAVSRLFASIRKPGTGFSGIMDALGSLVAGAMVGVTLPVWLGALAAKKTLDYSKNDKGDAGGSVWSRLNDGTPFGSYKNYARNGRIVRVYGWSLSGRTFFQSVVLGLVAGPIVAFLLSNPLGWSMFGMAAAPFVVDLLKPTWIYTNEPANPKGDAGGKVGMYQLAGASMGVVVTLIAPITALAVVLMLGVLTLVDDVAMTRQGKTFNNADKETKFYFFAGGAAIATAVIYFTGLFGTPLLLAAAGTAVVSAVLGLTHRILASSKNNDKGDAGGKLGAVDVVYFSVMGVLLGIGLTMLSGFWPVAAAAAIAGLFGLLTVKVSRNIAGTGRAYDYTGNIFRATAIGMAMHANYALFLGGAILPGFLGAAILFGAAYWAYTKDAAQNAADKNDKGDAGGKIGRMDPFLALMGAFYVGLNPAPALIIVGILAAISFVSRGLALKRGQGYSDENQAGKFVGMGIGGVIGAIIFVATNAFTPFAIITPLAIFALAGIHLLLARGNDKGDAGGKVSGAANDDKGQAGGAVSGTDTPVLITLRSPGTRAELDAELLRWRETYGFQRDYDWKLVESKDAAFPVVSVRGLLADGQRAALSREPGVLDIDASIKWSSPIVTTPYARPADESYLRKGMRAVSEFSEGLALLISAPFMFAVMVALFGPLFMGAKGTGLLQTAILGGAIANLFMVTQLQVLFAKVSPRIKAAVPQFFLALGGIALITLQHPFLGALALVNAVIGWRSIAGMLTGRYANAHSTDKFVNSFEASLLFSAIGMQLMALAWTFTRPAWAAVVFVASFAIYALSAIRPAKSTLDQARQDKGDAAGAVGDDKPLTAAQAEQGILAKTYSWMTLGLGITAAAAQAAIVTGIATTVLASLPMMIGLAVLQLVLVIGLSLAINKLSPGAALTGFLAYSAVNGLFLAPLVAMFTVGSVGAAFLVTAGMFGVMAVLGHTIKANLNSVGSYGMMALTGVILASIVNMFLHSTGLGALLTYATILIFVGLTAYDAQKIKEMAQKQGTLSKDDQSRIAVMGALTLYLDFINLFIQLLKILGKAKSKD